MEHLKKLTKEQLIEKIKLLQEKIPVSLTSIGEVISENKEFENNLESERILLKEIFNSVDEGIVVCDENGIVTSCNKAARKFHGLPQKPISVEAWTDHYNLYLADGKTPMKKEDVPLYRALKEGEVHDIEMVIKSVKGDVYNLVASGKRLFDQLGKCIGAMVTMHNITDRTEVERRLKESDEKLAKFINESKDAQSITNGEGNIILWNKAHEELTGYSAKEILNKKIWDIQYKLLPDEDKKTYSKEFIKQTIKKIIAENNISKNLRNVIKIKHKNGDIRYVEQSVFQINIGKEILIGNINRDVTERKKNEKALIESEEKFRILVTSMDDLVFVFDKQKRFVYFHASESHELYVKPEEFLGKKNSEVMPAYENDLFEKAFADVQKGKSHRFEYSLDMYSEIRWYSMLLSPMYKDSKFSGALAVVRNITEQKRNYDAVQTYRKHLEDIVKIGESASSSLQLKTVLNNILEGTIKSINASVGMIFLKNSENHLYFAASLGLSDKFVKSYDNVLIKPGEGLSGRISESGKPIFIKEDSSNDPRIARKVVANEKLNSFYGVPIMADKEIIGVMNILTRPPVVLEEDDFKLIEAVCVKVGLSIKNAQLYEKLQDSESELKEAYEKSMESDRLKSAFLATMSHELRTPLNAIIGFSDLLKEKQPIEKTLKYANLVNNNGRHLLDIVEDLFDVTLLEIGQTNLNRGHYSLNSILETVNALIDSEKNKVKSDIQIRYNPEAEEDITIYTDKSKLKQILVNLLKNAVKFTSEGYIEYGYRKVLKEGVSLLQFYVKDTGIGINKEKQKFIFEIFRQADETLTRHYGGTGIGLFVVKRFVEILGGNINLKSELGKGSTFYFTIPYMEEEIKEQTINEISTDK